MFDVKVKGFHTNLNKETELKITINGSNKSEVEKKAFSRFPMFKKGTHELISAKFIGTNYSEQLPKKVSKGRCEALLDQGQRCTNKAVIEVSVHLDTENIDYPMSWLAVKVCEEHNPKN